MTSDPGDDNAVRRLTEVLQQGQYSTDIARELIRARVESWRFFYKCDDSAILRRLTAVERAIQP